MLLVNFDEAKYRKNHRTEFCQARHRLKKLGIGEQDANNEPDDVEH